MLFSSMTFVFMFMPIVLGIYFLSRERLRNHVLLVASIIFYQWGGIGALGVMLGVILFSYAGAMAIEHLKKPKLFLAISIIGCLSILFYFKYTNFVVSQAGMNWAAVVLPLGISFYIFQAISYLVDVYRKQTAAQKNPLKYALYISMFPALVAGPIVKYHQVSEQIDRRFTTSEDFIYGLRRFIIGLAKKVLIANTCGQIADSIFGLMPNIDAPTAWLGIIAYSFQIYFDFSGYSDMAIGLMRIFGFKIPENFNYPYISKSITEFWRRWHISLSAWFKEYLYIPLGGNRTGHTTRNLWIVFLATGIWHGAEWTFILWGLWHGLFIVLEKKIGPEKFNKWWGHIYAMAIVMFGWVLFRAPNIKSAGQYLGKMFGFGSGSPIYRVDWFADNWQILILAAAILLSAPVFAKVMNTKRTWVLNSGLILLFVLTASFLAANTYNPFIYFRF